MDATALRRLLGCATLTLGLTHCAPRHDLSASFGQMYRQQFAAQMGAHPSRDLSPFSGEESRRIHHSYLDALGDDPDSASGGGGGSSNGRSAPPAGFGGFGR